MSRVHQAELIILLFSLLIGFWQSQEMLPDQWQYYDEDCPSKTHWNQVPYKTLRAYVWVHILGLSVKYSVKLIAWFWIWLGGL